MAPEPVWIFWGREKYLPLSRIETRVHPAHNLVAIAARHVLCTFLVIVAILSSVWFSFQEGKFHLLSHRLRITSDHRNKSWRFIKF